MREAEYGAKQIERHLIDGTIRKAIVDKDGEQFGFLVRMPSGEEKTVWVLSDAEGNGAGWLDIAAHAKPARKKPLHETERFEVRVERKKVHILRKADDVEYSWPAKYTDQILARIASGGVDPTCEHLLPKQEKAG